MEWTVRRSNPVEAIFSAPVQTRSGAHPAYHTMGTVYSLDVKRPGRGVDHPPPLSAYVKDRIELTLTNPVDLMACSKVIFISPYFFYSYFNIGTSGHCLETFRALKV
jgi:malate/lactate dehydrogenase